MENEKEYFDLRLISKSQNILSLIEPRLKPLPVENFNIVFDSSTMNLEFSWDSNYANFLDLFYEIDLINDNNFFTVFKIIALTSFKERIYEFGK